MGDLGLNSGMLLIESTIFLGGFVMLILFLRTQQRILLAVKPNNRQLSPSLVWLQLVPLFGLIWQFVVVVRIAGSLSKEKISRLEESLMNNSTSPEFPASDYPTRAIGLTYCILTIAYTLNDLYVIFRPRSTSVSIARAYNPGIEIYLITLVPLAIILGAFSCWIAYWISLARIRRELVRFAS
jgi:hypothetical protein